MKAEKILLKHKEHLKEQRCRCEEPGCSCCRCQRCWDIINIDEALFELSKYKNRQECLHVYRNKVVESFVAECIEEAIEIAKDHYREMLYDRSEWDLNLTQVPDDTIITLTDENDESHDKFRKKTAKEWTAIYGKGFLGSTEY